MLSCTRESCLEVCYIVPGKSYESNISVRLAIENKLSNIASQLIKVATETTYLWLVLPARNIFGDGGRSRVVDA